MSNYFISTTDSPSHKALFCGRKKEIEDILKWISAGKNIAIIGETRIGKTFLRYVLRDICTGSFSEYVDRMIDEDVSNFIKEASKSIPIMKVVNLSLHSIREGEFFYSSLADELISGPVTAEKLSAYNLKQIIIKKVIPQLRAEKRRLVFFLDEFDVVREYSNFMEVLGFLKDLSEEQDLFSLIIFGWPGVLDRIRAKYTGVESTLVDCIDKKLYLPPLDIQQTKLLINPLLTHCAGLDCDKMTACIHSLTGGRPCFTQYICDHLIQDGKVKEYHEKDGTVCIEEVLDQFNRDRSIRDIISSIWHAGFEKESELLAYIAHYPGATLEALVSFYSKYQQYEIQDNIERLSKYRLINIIDKKVFITGRVIERWGQIRKEDPVRTYSRKRIESDYAERASFAFATSWEHPQTDAAFDEVICRLVNEFQHNVEQKKGNILLWLANEPAPEEHAQILFDLIADQYAQLADINIDREIETGRGPVDFKFSRGHRFQAHLEVKRATSSKLEHGLRKQLPTYLRADKVPNGYYLIVCYDEGDLKKADKLTKEAVSLAKELNINLRAMSIKAYQKFESASKVE